MEVNRQVERLQHIQDVTNVLRDVAVKAVDAIRHSTSMSMREKVEFIEWAENRLEEANG